MRVSIVMICGLLLVGTGTAEAQQPRPPDTKSTVDATIGNSILQVRYLSESPFGPARSDLDYGLLLSEDNDVIGSVAMMFDTNLDLLPRLRFRIGPQAYLARLTAPTKTDFFALAAGANASYEIVERLGLSVFGSAFYSPGVLTFGSAHNLYDFTAGAEIKFTSRLSGMAGYRWLKVTVVAQPDIRVQNEVFAGLRWQLD
ncbi:MAG: YfaZ precursor [Gammaproteobacteria bacterium]|nr:YfaZ precursor [Gammaproteobacteria bacterium]